MALIGAGESGKTTVLRQMRLIYAKGFDKHERLEWIPVIFDNVVQSFRTISKAMAELDCTFDSYENEVSGCATPFSHPLGHCQSLPVAQGAYHARRASYSSPYRDS